MLRRSCQKIRLRRSLIVPARNLSKTVGNAAFNSSLIERAEDEVDVCIVGGGPAGLSAAIRLKQLEKEKGNEIRVVVLEKGSEVGMPPFNSSECPLDPLVLTRLAYRFRGCSGTQSTERTHPELVFYARPPSHSACYLLADALPHPQAFNSNPSSASNV